MEEKNAETRGLLSCPHSTRDLRGHLSAGLRRRTGQALGQPEIRIIGTVEDEVVKLFLSGGGRRARGDLLIGHIFL